ncbi:MAG: hypothetical protein WCI27_08180, partial [Candidatus Omnitrophota bacterium]
YWNFFKYMVEAQQDRYPVGKEILVYFDPHKPERSFVTAGTWPTDASRRRRFSMERTFAIFGLLLVGLGIGRSRFYSRVFGRNKEDAESF